MTEYGIFNDEGLVEGDFYTPEEAREAIRERYETDDDLIVLEVCPEHREQPRHACDECDDFESDDVYADDLEDYE